MTPRNKFKNYNKNNLKKGFTLVELLVSVGIFVIVVFVACGALINLANVNDKSQAFMIAFENLDFGLENISRTIRNGSNYTCDVQAQNNFPAPLTDGNDCAHGNGLHLVDQNNNKVFFRLKVADWDQDKTTGEGGMTGAVTRTRILAGQTTVESEIPITSPEIDIKSMTFIVTGSKSEFDGDPKHMQPRVLLSIKGRTVLRGTKPDEQADFNVQTTMTQRKDDRMPRRVQ